MAPFIALLFVFVALVVGALALLSTKGQSKSSSSTQGRQENSAQVYTYSCQNYLFTRSEAAFYRALQEAIADQYLVFGKVRVADVLKPQTESRGDWQRAFNQISAKHFDFVLCDKTRLKILAVVELDDSSHQRADRVKRDNFLNQAVASAGLPFLRFPVAATYESKSIQQTINQTLLPRPEKPRVKRPNSPKNKSRL